MKFILLSIVATTMLFACNKKDKNETENHCPIIAATAVPQVVKDSFALRYPSLTVNTWFEKTGVGYCAYFIQSVNQKKLAEFTTTGVFVSEEVDVDHDGNFEDSTSHVGVKGTAVCECEIPD